MNIYFAGSISAGREFAHIQKELIDFLKSKGKVLTEHIGQSSLTSAGENMPDRDIHDRDMNWILSADVLVAEVSVPSLGVGYEIGRALEHGKKILCLYQQQEGKRLSGMIAGCSGITCAPYDTIDQAHTAISQFMDSIAA